MATLSRNSRYVPAQPDGWLHRLWRWLTLQFLQGRLHRPSTAKPSPKRTYEAAVPIIIHTETPPAIHYARDRAQEARRLLHRYLKGQPTSRRACMDAGMSQGAWQRARKTLTSAGVIACADAGSNRKGMLVYGPRDSQLRLDAHLAAVERRCYSSKKFVSP